MNKLSVGVSREILGCKRWIACGLQSEPGEVWGVPNLALEYLALEYLARDPNGELARRLKAEDHKDLTVRQSVVFHC